MSRKEKNKESALQKENYKQRIEKMRNALCIEYFDNFPPLMKDILSQKLEDSTEDCDIYFDEDEIKTISTELMPFIKDVMIKIEEEKKNYEVDALTTFEYVVRVTDIMFNCVENYSSIPDVLMQIIFYFNKNLRSDVLDLKMRDMMCALCEKCCQKRLELSGSFVLETLYFLFDQSLKDNNKNPQREIKRIMNLQEVLSRLDVDGTIFKQLSPKFFQTIKSPSYLSCKPGQQFISFFLTFDLKLMKRVHNVIKEFLFDATKVQASAFGKIYHAAWLNSTEESRQAVETHCIQDLMTHIFTLKRSAGYMEMSDLGRKVLAILSYFHTNRKLIHLSKVITELYTPLIWSNLRSGNNIIRCNAAEVFLDVYPLEKPGVGRADQAIFLQRQHDEMADLLTDNCHVVRIIAAKGICSCLKNLWETFSPESIKVLMETMVNDMINDASSDVRKAVFQGFTNMLKSRSSAAYLAKVLPSLRDHIHDESEKVRRAFVDMLIQIKELPEIVPLNYFDVVPAKHLTARLALENEMVGRPLVKLIMSEIYIPDQPWSAIMKRIYKIILMNHEAARKLFTFSKKILPVDVVVDIITNILIVMHNRFKEVVETKSENVVQEESDALHKKKRRKPTNALREINGNENLNGSLDSTSSSSPESNGNESSVNVQPERHQLDDLNVCQIFIEIVTILWTVNSAQLKNQGDKDKEKFERFNNVTASCVPLFLRYFKGTKVYFSVIHFASLIPLSRLTPISTIASMCVSHLKGLSKNCKDEETEVYVNALCSWRRAPEVLELATDWLDQAFRSEKLNQSAALRSSARRKVKFPQCEAKPLLALKLIDIIFKYELNRNQVLEKYNAVFEMYIYLERVKVLIERRMSMDAPFPDAELSDEFLQKSLYRYAKLMLILHKPNDDNSTENTDDSVSRNSTVSNVNEVIAPQSFPKFTDWAIRILVPKIPESLDYENDDLPLSVNLLQLIVRAGTLMISANFTSKFSTSNFINFVNILLESGCKLAFVNDAFRALKELVFNSETHYERDEENLLRNDLPTLLTNILFVLMESKLKKDAFAFYLPNFTEMKNCLLSLPLALVRSFSVRSRILRNIIVSFTTSCIRVMADDIQELGIFDKTDKFQNLPYCTFFIVGALLSRDSICGIWYNCLPEVTSSLGEDSIQLLAMVSLLHTLSFVKKPKRKELLVKAVKHAYEIIKALPAGNSNKSTNESLNGSMKETLSPRKLGIPVLKEIATRLGFVLA